jgi:hypothetical protein
MTGKIPSWVRPGAFLTTVESEGDSEDVGENDRNAKVRTYRVMRGAKGELTAEVKGRLRDGPDETLNITVQDLLKAVSMDLPAKFPDKFAVTEGELTLVFRLIGKDSFRLGGSIRPCRHIKAPLEMPCSCSGSRSCQYCGGTGMMKATKSIDIWVDDATGIMLKCGCYDEGEPESILRVTSTNIFSGPSMQKSSGGTDAKKKGK